MISSQCACWNGASRGFAGVSTKAGGCSLDFCRGDDAMTGPITLHTAIAAYPHVQAIRSGTVASALLRFDFEDVPVITRAFRRMVRTLDFDLCEIALTTLAQAHAYGKPITALPIVVMRGFHHAALVCPVGSLIRGPTDLRGKRIGVRAWSQTTGVWVRGILLEDY